MIRKRKCRTITSLRIVANFSWEQIGTRWEDAMLSDSLQDQPWRWRFLLWNWGKIMTRSRFHVCEFGVRCSILMVCAFYSCMQTSRVWFVFCRLFSCIPFIRGYGLTRRGYAKRCSKCERLCLIVLVSFWRQRIIFHVSAKSLWTIFQNHFL